MRFAASFFVCALLVGCVSSSPRDPASAAGSEPQGFHAFPENFQWCAATAAHQVEGNNVDNDHWAWEQASRAKGAVKSGEAADHWNRYEEDFLRLKQLGLQAYRMSIEWSRVEPQQGVIRQDVVAHYRKMILKLLELGITPQITLHHFTTPLWVVKKGSWEWEGMPQAFANFARLVATEIAPEVDTWYTVNEPMVVLGGGYQTGILPPGEKRALKDLAPVLRGFLKVHAAAYHALHDVAEAQKKTIRVGLASHLRYFEAKLPLLGVDLAAKVLVDHLWNWMLLDALESGRIVANVPGQLQVNDEIPGLRGTQDFLGINYYSSDLISMNFKTMMPEQLPRANAAKTDLGWDIYPKGLFEVLTKANQLYHKPIILSEVGVADAKDAFRKPYMKDHFYWAWRAINAGVKLEGLCWWSLLDNFEWNEGFEARFGLYQVDFKTQERNMRPSATFLRDVANDNGLVFTKPEIEAYTDPYGLMKRGSKSP